MYGFNLRSVTIRDFFDYIKERELLQSHSLLKKNIEESFAVVLDLKINTLQDLADMIKTKVKALKTFKDTTLTEEYVVILRRQVNSFVAKPRKLQDFILINDSTVKRLEELSITNTKQLSERMTELSMDVQCMDYLKTIAEVTQLRYVGHMFAEALYLSGYKTIHAISTANPEPLAKEINESIQKLKVMKFKVGIPDAMFLIEDANLYLKWK